MIPAVDPNNATWYWLGYARDFEPQPAGPYDPSQPISDPALFFDDARGVLELLPAPVEEEVAPPPGIAVDVNGEIYRSEKSAVTIERCDGRRDALVCDSYVFAGPRGLALDRRGYLYVADARARRVVVVLPDDGGVQAILGHPYMSEPVDVAVTPSGLVYIADRGGRIHVFDSRFRFVLSFSPINAEGLPADPRPIAIMSEEDGTISVADGNHPRLLHFMLAGEPLADLPAPVAEPLTTSALKALYGPHAPRFLAGACRPPRPAHDGGEALSAVHREIRRHLLSLGRSLETKGVMITGALDSGRPGTLWHRVEAHTAIPPGTSLTIETSTSDDLGTFDPAAAAWSAALDDAGTPISFAGTGWELTSRDDNQLILSPPGRYLWLRVTLKGDGRATPSLRAIRLLYPRASYLDLLPRVYRLDPEGARFLERFLALFEHRLTSIEDSYEEFSRLINPDAAPLEIINWLACLIDLSFDPSWPLDKRRALVAAAMDLYRLRGTPEGIRRYIEIYTGMRPEIIETFLERPRRAPALGRSGTILGCSVALTPCRPDTTPDETLYVTHAHRFRVLVYVDDRCDAATIGAVVNRILEVNRPAHTEHSLCLVFPAAQLGLQSQVGLDFVLGGRESPRLQIGEEPRPPAGVLGRDTMPGNLRHQYVRPLEVQI
jgi:phage tail-like protein